MILTSHTHPCLNIRLSPPPPSPKSSDQHRHRRHEPASSSSPSPSFSLRTFNPRRHSRSHSNSHSRSRSRSRSRSQSQSRSNSHSSTMSSDSTLVATNTITNSNTNINPNHLSETHVSYTNHPAGMVLDRHAIPCAYYNYSNGQRLASAATVAEDEAAAVAEEADMTMPDSEVQLAQNRSLNRRLLCSPVPPSTAATSRRASQEGIKKNTIMLKGMKFACGVLGI